VTILISTDFNPSRPTQAHPLSHKTHAVNNFLTSTDETLHLKAAVWVFKSIPKIISSFNIITELDWYYQFTTRIDTERTRPLEYGDTESQLEVLCKAKTPRLAFDGVSIPPEAPKFIL
jgi:hypothetical protein